MLVFVNLWKDAMKWMFEVRQLDSAPSRFLLLCERFEAVNVYVQLYVVSGVGLNVYLRFESSS